MSTAPPSSAPRVHPVPIAPALNGKPTPPNDNEQTMNFTCATCSRRKVKCDKVSKKDYSTCNDVLSPLFLRDLCILSELSLMQY